MLDTQAKVPKAERLSTGAKVLEAERLGTEVKMVGTRMVVTLAILTIDD